MIDIKMEAQPTDETCGPTCLHAIYQYYQHNVDLNTVIQTVKRSCSGGTLAAYLGIDAQKNGFKTTIYVNNVDLFDPTWFNHLGHSKVDLYQKLKEQSLKKKQSKGTHQSNIAYLEYLALQGNIKFKTITPSLLKQYFAHQIPILTGLSSTYLYQCARESFSTEGHAYFDDIEGSPCGHFVVLCGYDDIHHHIVVADPYRKNPLSDTHYYKVSSYRLINAIMLGVLTYDANLLIINPKDKENNGNLTGH